MWPLDAVPIETPLNTILKKTPKCGHQGCTYTGIGIGIGAYTHGIGTV